MYIYANINSYRGFFRVLLLSSDWKTFYNIECTLKTKHGVSQKHCTETGRREEGMLTGRQRPAPTHGHANGGNGALMSRPMRRWAESFST